MTSDDVVAEHGKNREGEKQGLERTVAPRLSLEDTV